MPQAKINEAFYDESVYKVREGHQYDLTQCQCDGDCGDDDDRTI